MKRFTVAVGICGLLSLTGPAMADKGGTPDSEHLQPDRERGLVAMTLLFVRVAMVTAIPLQFEPFRGLLPAGAAGSVWAPHVKLVASDAAAADFFGRVAVSESTAVVGSIGDDDGGEDSGSAYVFTRSGNRWTEQAKLVAPDAAASDFFGGSVAVSGSTIVVGAAGDDDGGANSGSAYVFGS